MKHVLIFCIYFICVQSLSAQLQHRLSIGAVGVVSQRNPELTLTGERYGAGLVFSRKYFRADVESSFLVVRRMQLNNHIPDLTVGLAGQFPVGPYTPYAGLSASLLGGFNVYSGVSHQYSKHWTIDLRYNHELSNPKETSLRRTLSLGITYRLTGPKNHFELSSFGLRVGTGFSGRTRVLFPLHTEYSIFYSGKYVRVELSNAYFPYIAENNIGGSQIAVTAYLAGQYDFKILKAYVGAFLSRQYFVVDSRFNDYDYGVFGAVERKISKRFAIDLRARTGFSHYPLFSLSVGVSLLLNKD